jgi:hypothetical protein
METVITSPYDFEDLVVEIRDDDSILMIITKNVEGQPCVAFFDEKHRKLIPVIDMVPMINLAVSRLSSI